MFFNNEFNTFFGLNLTLVYTFPMCMAWRFQFPIRKYDFKIGVEIGDETLPRVETLCMMGGLKPASAGIYVT